MSISKKLSAVVSAAAVVASMFAVAPANAETTAAFINRTVANSVDRPIDEVAHTVKFYAGEEFDLYFNANIKDSTFASKVTANSVLTADGGYSIQSGTLSATTSKNAYFSGQLAGAVFNVMNDRTATDLKATKTLTAAPTGVNVNISVSGTATTDVILVFNPTVKIDDYVLVASDMQYTNTNSSSRSGGGYNPESNGKSRVARAEDSNFNFFAETGCINTSGLTAGDVLEHTMTVSDGTSNVGTSNPYWQVKNAQGMSNGMGVEGSSFTFDSLPEGSTLSVNSWVKIAAPVVGTTYTFGEVKVVKQGTTQNLLTHCATTGATASAEVNAGILTVTIDKTADTTNMGQKFDSYTCALYAAADSSRATVVKSSRGYMMAPSGMGAPATKCIFNNVAAGSYVVGVRGSSWNGLSDEKIATGTITVTGAVTPAAKKTPKVPTVATKLKVGKTLTVALHSTKGTATKGANADGLATVVAASSASKKYCSVTKVIKSKKITGYTVKGLKAGKCSVVVTITGSSTFNSLTKTLSVTVSK